MTPLARRTPRWLKICHVLLAVSWLISSTTLLLILHLAHAEDGARLVSVNHLATLLDDLVVIPSAAGTCLTALLLTLLRPRALETAWIIASWVIVVSIVVFGVFWLGPALNSLLPVAKQLGVAALADPGYADARGFLLVAAPFQVGALFVVLYLCVRKPWSAAPRLGPRR
jgi:uncharacterized membrane protein